jgi:DNA mismatch repair protein MutS
VTQAAARPGREGFPNTPLYGQYLDLRARCPGSLLLFRLGDFYELFGEEARLASSLLGLTLTSRDGQTPMCGVPAASLEETVARLVTLGQRVAVAEQEEAEQGDRLLPRRLVRLASPGTYVGPEEGGEAQEGRSRLLAAVAAGEAGEPAAMAVGEVMTGRLRVRRLAGSYPEEELRTLVAALEPAEILVDPTLAAPVRDALSPVALPWPGLWEEAPAPGVGTGALPEKERLPDPPASTWASLPEADEACRRAVTAMYRYVAALTGQVASFFRPAQILTGEAGWDQDLEGSRLILDGETRRQLELTRTLAGQRAPTLLSLLDRTLTPMGRRLLAAWIEAPLTQPKDILERQEGIAQLVEQSSLRHEVRACLTHVGDVHRLAVRAAGETATPRELVRLGRSLMALGELSRTLGQAPPGPLRSLAQSLEAQVPLDLGEEILATLTEAPPLSAREGGLVRTGADADVDRLRDLAAGGRTALSQLEERERERLGVKALRLGYHRRLGYYLEIPRGRVSHLPPEYRLVQGMATSARYTTPDLEAHSAAVAHAESRLWELEYQIFVALRAKVRERAPALREVAQLAAEVDVRQSLAEVAAREGWTRPRLVAGRGLFIQEGRHPVVEAAVGPGRFVANDVELGGEADLILVTGPNMGGKSTYLRQTALLVILAQMGAFLPARYARISPVDRVFARIGTGDNLAGGQSTFLVEMAQTAAILQGATRKSLVVIDELGRGTATFDGLALAWAVIEHLAQRMRPLALVATHFHELISLVERLPRARNVSVQAVEAGGEVRFLRRVVPGGADRSYGIAVARLAGVPHPVLRRAEDILRALEAGEMPRADTASAPRQLRLLADGQDALRREILALDLGRTSPLDALVYLTALQERLRREEAQG